MNWYSIFYWITVADNIKSVTYILAIIFGVYFIIASALALGLGDSTYSDWEKGNRRVYILFTILFIINIFVWMFLPSKKDALAIVAGGAIGNFVTTDSSARQIPHEALELVRYKLIEWRETSIDEQKDTLVNKSKEELIELLKNKK